MPTKSRDMERMLTGKLEAQTREGSSHTKYFVTYEGTLLGRTLLSRGSGDIPDNLMGAMARQLGVSGQQLRFLLDCSWQYDDYVRHKGF
jgi:hypothetical protein